MVETVSEIASLWGRILQKVKEKLNDSNIFDAFFAASYVDHMEGSTLVVVANTGLAAALLDTKYRGLLNTCILETTGTNLGLVFVEEEHLKKEAPVDKKPSFFKESHLNPNYTFKNFVVGQSNREAYQASLMISENPGKLYNPLLIYSNSGLGKTHLLFAIGQSIHEHFPKKRIAYVKGDDFTNRMINSLQNRKMQEFRDEFRKVDLFLVDDIQFIAGKQSTQEEFFHTFNSIYEAGNQIVITSDRPPLEMSLLDDRLRTRFEGGVMADVQPPDLETRMVIIRNKAAQLGLILSEDAILYIANNITANIRQLEGVIKKLTAYKEILNEVITTESVKRAIEDVIRTGSDIPKPDKIMRETSRYYSISEDEIRGLNRSKLPTEARQVAMYLMRSLTNLSLKEIGEQFTGRNHATVLSSIRKIEDILKIDPAMAAKIRDISSNINSI